MKLHNALALSIITCSLYVQCIPTLRPYNVQNQQEKNAVLNLYTTAKHIENIRPNDIRIPLVLEGVHQGQAINTPMQPNQASVFVDDHNDIIGLVIYADTTIQNQRVSAIKELVMATTHVNQARALLTTFEQQKRTAGFRQVNAYQPDDPELFTRAGFRATRDPNMFAKNISRSRTCCIQ